MHRTAILDDYVGNALALADWSEVDSTAHVTSFKRHLSQAEAVQALREFSILVLMRERMTLTRELIDKLPNLRFVVFSGPTNAAIDMTALGERGVIVARTVVPAARATQAVPAAPAEMAWALLMAAARQIPQEDAHLRGGGWNARNGTSLRGRTLGILGFGKIGRVVAGYAAAFGMKVVAWSQNLQPELLEGTSAVAVSKSELFESSDFISLHYKLSSRSAGLVGAADIARMKPSAFLINTARGELIDEPALIVALQERRIAGAALDVFTTEPLPLDHPLRTLSNAILTPHLGYATEDFMRSSYQRSMEAVLAFLKGDPVNVVTAEMLAAGR